MINKRDVKNRIGKTVLGWILGILMLTGLVGSPLLMATSNAYAEPETTESNSDNGSNNGNTETNTAENGSNGTNDNNENGAGTNENGENAGNTQLTGASCEDSLESLGWLVCPATGKIAEAVDWLYAQIQGVLEINPIEIKDGSPIYEVWKYFQGVTNIVFVIFLLVVIYSQITGVGISNYGIKKVLPKLIVVAVLVNLSFVLCSLLVDLSNIIGNSLRGVFTTIQETALAGTDFSQLSSISMASMYSAMADGLAIGVGAGVIAFETGAIWMLIPTVLAGIVAVASGLITIAMRQAVVILLIIISPLAIVAYMLPNTEDWFKKWKQLLTKMLVFYPTFSLLFGASQLAGFAIMASATNGFGIILGAAVQIFPLFFSWSLMKMSGTFLESINTKLRTLGNKPVAGVRTWADERRNATRMRYLAQENAYMPSTKLRQYISNRRLARQDDMDKNTTVVKQRALAYDAQRKRRRDGTVSKEGEADFKREIQLKRYERAILKDQNDISKGLGSVGRGALGRDAEQRARLRALDAAMVAEADRLKVEQARTERIDYGNAVSFHQRMEDAMNAHFDERYRGLTDKEGNVIYKEHFSPEEAKYQEALNRYNDAKQIMEGDARDAQYAAAYAAHAYDTQAKIIMTKFQKYFELTPPTRDVRYRLQEFSKLAENDPKMKAVDNIDTIISGLRILNERGDTDFIKEILDDVLDQKYGGLQLGTHASQAIASFLMQDVKDADPFLRRFGKYLNLETARLYDESKRKEPTVTYDEYVKGYHVEPDGSIMYAKRGMAKLLEGTSLDGIERTALDNYNDSLMKVYMEDVWEDGQPVFNEDGTRKQVLNVEEFLAKRTEVEKAIGPQFISAQLKYLSGSEQITSSVKSKTGYFAKQDKNTGAYSMVALWEDPEKRLLYGDTQEEWDRIESWYRNQTLDYLRGSTPAQILGLRSDYEIPLIEHLAKAYLLDDDGNVIDEKQAKHDALVQAINDTYGADSDEAKKRLTALKRQEAGEALRELLYRKGKLGQIEKTKRSGAGNNAKDWVRELLLLDGDTALKSWIIARQAQDEQAGKTPPKQDDGPDDGGSGPNGGGGAPSGSGPTGSNGGGSSEGGDAPEPVIDDGGGVVEPSETTSNGSKSGGGAAPVSGGAAKPSTPSPSKGTPSTPSVSNKGKKNKLPTQEEINKMLKELEQQKQYEADPNLTTTTKAYTYTSDDAAGFQAAIEDIWHDVHDDADEDEEYDMFFNESYKYICQELGNQSYIATAYARFYEEFNTSESYDLREFLVKLLGDLNNY